MAAPKFTSTEQRFQEPEERPARVILTTHLGDPTECPCGTDIRPGSTVYKIGGSVVCQSCGES